MNHNPFTVFAFFMVALLVIALLTYSMYLIIKKNFRKNTYNAAYTACWAVAGLISWQQFFLSKPTGPVSTGLNIVIIAAAVGLLVIGVAFFIKSREQH